MTITRRAASWLAAAIAATLAIAPALSARAAEAESGFEAIFDGHSLDGWLGQDMSFWSVEDGAITGTITPEHAPAMNQYLVYQGGLNQGGLIDDFELKLEFRLTGSTTPNTNGGFQFRSRRMPDGDVAGYQVDNNFGQPWKVRLYDEFGRHDLALEGQQSRFDSSGQKQVEPLELAAGALDFQLDQWHEYHLVADGPNLSLSINGKLVAACVDDDIHQFEPLGILAMQLHTGPPMKAQFRNLRLKRLPRTVPLTARQQVMATAALDWRLGRRASAHQPPLTGSGDIVAEITPGGERARPDAIVARMNAACFDAGKQWNSGGNALTVFLKARVPDGNWSYALFGKRAGNEAINFELFGDDLPGRSGGDVAFRIHTDSGPFQCAFPVSEIDPTAWHNLIARYDGKQIELLCDGKSLAHCEATGNLIANDAPLLIGAESDGANLVKRFSGEIEEAALWPRALSDEELRAVLRADAESAARYSPRLTPGDHEREITVDGRERSYLVHVPPGYDSATPTPVVLVLHGAGMTARMMVPFCDMHKKSDEAGFIAVYPNGTGAGGLYLTFNAGGLAPERAGRMPDDVRFIRQLLDDLGTMVKVDPKRVYAAGASNGGMMCYRLAAELTDRIAAVASVSGSLAADFKAQRPISILHFHGDEDPIVPFDGPNGTTPKFLNFKSVDESMRLWAAANGCPATPVTEELPDVEDDGTRVVRKTYPPGANGAEVVLYVIKGGGHTWPGQKSPLALIGKSTLDISANDLIWEFFQKHPLSE